MRKLLIVIPLLIVFNKSKNGDGNHAAVEL